MPVARVDGSWLRGICRVAVGWLTCAGWLADASSVPAGRLGGSRLVATGWIAAGWRTATGGISAVPPST